MSAFLAISIVIVTLELIHFLAIGIYTKFKFYKKRYINEFNYIETYYSRSIFGTDRTSYNKDLDKWFKSDEFKEIVRKKKQSRLQK